MFAECGDKLKIYIFKYAHTSTYMQVIKKYLYSNYKPLLII